MKLPGQYAKFLTAVAGQAVVYLQWKYGATGAEWLPIVLAAAAALGVYAVPNTPTLRVYAVPNTPKSPPPEPSAAAPPAP